MIYYNKYGDMSIVNNAKDKLLKNDDGSIFEQLKDINMNIMFYLDNINDKDDNNNNTYKFNDKDGNSLF
jgi:hypothetical protein